MLLKDIHFYNELQNVTSDCVIRIFYMEVLLL